jgi:hypothetical protein
MKKAIKYKYVGWIFLMFVSAVVLLPAHFVYASETDDFSMYFCDENFRNVVRGQANLNDGEPLTRQRLDGIRELTLNGFGIRCLVGIEYLPNLQFITALDNDLTDLNISQNTNLTTLRLHHNFFDAEFPHNIRGLHDGITLEFGVNPRHGTPPPHDNCIGVALAFESSGRPAETVANSSDSIGSSDSIESANSAEEYVPVVPISGNTDAAAATAGATATDAPSAPTSVPQTRPSVQIPSGEWEHSNDWSQTLELSVNLVRRDDYWEVVGNAEIIHAPSFFSTFLPWIIAAVAFVAFVITLIVAIRKKD